MPDVKHMKRWRWGVEGVSFHHEDKPAFQPFVINAIELDVNTPPTAPMSLDDLPIPAPLIGDQLLGELIESVGAETPCKMILTGSPLVRLLPGTVVEGFEEAVTGLTLEPSGLTYKSLRQRGWRAPWLMTVLVDHGAVGVAG